MNSLRRILKLRHMSAGEIVRRIVDARQKKYERSKFLAGVNPYEREFEVLLPTLDVDRLASVFLPGAQASNLRQIRERFPEDFAALQTLSMERAAQVFSPSFRLLGQPADVERNLNWHRDASSGYQWPMAFYGDISLYELGDGVDVKRIWELGRHQFLVSAAAALTMSGDLTLHTNSPQTERVRNILLDWIQNNPLHQGVHWTSGLEISVRLISWIWTLAHLGKAISCRKEDLDRITKSMAEHALYLEHHLSFDSSPYNHLIGEATGLYLAGMALEPWGSARRFRELGRKILTSHVARQFHADGFTVEQATGYHFFTLGFLLLAISAARAEGEPLIEVEQVAHRAFRAGILFRRPDGIWPAIGDLDSARSIPAVPTEFWNFDSLCHLAAVLFEDLTLKLHESFCGEELFWMMGYEGIERFRRIPAAANTSRGALLQESGYAVAIREDDEDSDRAHLVFDAGPISAGLHRDATPSTAHGHADTLAVLYFSGGKERLRDSGIPYYYGPNEWVNHFRSAAAHNTLEIDGVSFVRSAGRLAWSNATPAPKLQANLSENVWITRGSLEWENRVLVERTLLALPGVGLLVTDFVQSDRPRAVRCHWQLPEQGCVNDLVSTAVHWRDPEDGTLLAVWSNDGDVESHLQMAAAGSPIGWQASDYGSTTSASRLTVTVEPRRELLLCTWLGRSPLAFRVATGEHSVQGVLPADSQTNSVSPLNSAGIARLPDQSFSSTDRMHWIIQTPGLSAEYQAGLNAAPNPSGWSRLNGAGGWPVFWRPCTSISQIEQPGRHRQGVKVDI